MARSTIAAMHVTTCRIAFCARSPELTQKSEVRIVAKEEWRFMKEGPQRHSHAQTHARTRQRHSPSIRPRTVMSSKMEASRGEWTFGEDKPHRCAARTNVLCP